MSSDVIYATGNDAPLDLPPGVNEAAVIQTLTENPYFAAYYNSLQDPGEASVGGFLRYCEKAGHEAALNDPDTQILKDYADRNSSIRDYRVAGFEDVDGQGSKIVLAADNGDGTSSYYFGFAGTGKDEWGDNAEGMYSISTPQQQDAERYFNEMVRQLGITEADTVNLVGHSKGGNKAQYITMSSEYGYLVDTCYAIDGEGFSPEAVDLWMRNPEGFEERRSKIVLVAGQRDYVHADGVIIAKKIHYLHYDEAEFNRSDPEFGDVMNSYHNHLYLFNFTYDEKTHQFTFTSELQPPDTQGEIAKWVMDLSDRVMTLPPDERKAACITFMSAVAIASKGGAVDGLLVRPSDLKSTIGTLFNLLKSYLNGESPEEFAQRQELARQETALDRWLANVQQMREQQLERRAMSVASAYPYIYIQTEVVDQLGLQVRSMGDLFVPEMARALRTIYNDVNDVLDSAQSLADSISAFIEGEKRTLEGLKKAASSAANLDIVGFVEGVVDMGAGQIDAVRGIINTATSLLTLVFNIIKGLTDIRFKLSEYTLLMENTDQIRAVGDYMSNTAKRFQFTEDGVRAKLTGWGG